MLNYIIQIKIINIKYKIFLVYTIQKKKTLYTKLLKN